MIEFAELKEIRHVEEVIGTTGSALRKTSMRNEQHMHDLQVDILTIMRSISAAETRGESSRKATSIDATFGLVKGILRLVFVIFAQLQCTCWRAV